MSSMPEVRALMARVMVARGIADPAAFDCLLETTVERTLRVRRGRLAARISIAITNLSERANRLAELPADPDRIACPDAAGGIVLPFRNLKELHR